MTFYSDIAATAVDLLTEFGQSATLTRTTQTGGSPTSTVEASEADTTSTITVAILPMDSPSVGQDLGETAIRSTDVRIYVAPDGTAPQNGDRIWDYTVLRCNVMQPGGVVVLYDCIGRK